MDAIALTDFVHGDIKAREGHPVVHRNGKPIGDALVLELEKAGLVRVRPQRVRVKPVSPELPVGKAPDDGRGQPSSASPAAPALPTTTLKPSAGGAKRVRRTIAAE